MNIDNLSIAEIRAVLSRLDCYFFVKDQDLKYTYVNDAVARLFEKSAEEIVGRDDSQFFDLTVCHELLLHDRKVLAGESISQVEKNTDLNGNVRHFQNLKTPIYDDKGRVVGVFGLAIDISDSIAKHDKLEYLAIRDVLTGVFNRRYLELQMKKEIASHVRHSKPLSFIMLDVDNFKSINDKYGHSIGDYVLQQVGKVMLTSVREEDGCFRFGGDEFALLLPHTSLACAFQLAERLRKSIAKLTFFSEDGEEFTINISLGVSQLSESNQGLFMAKADEALMAVKRNHEQKNATLVHCETHSQIASCSRCQDFEACLSKD